MSRGPGRPSKLTPEVEARYLQAIRVGSTRADAAALCGLDRRTVERWMQRAEEQPTSEYAAFAARVHEADAHGVAAALAHITKASQKDWRAAAWMVERRRPEAYGKRETVKHEGSVDAPVVVDIWRADVQDAARALEDALAKPSDG